MAGDSIPLYGRICSVADVFDALTNERVYKEALGNDEVLEIMEGWRGAHFDPKVLDALLCGMAEIGAIQEEQKRIVNCEL